MKWLLYCCFSFCSFITATEKISGQSAMIDQRAMYIPPAETQSSSAIAAYIQQHFNTDREKITAIYSWVVSNIRYDTDSMLPINWSLEQEAKVAATLRRRKGVCENYASLFTDIANKAGFPSFVVSGYTRQSGAVNQAGHSWCAVLFEKQWYLCDPTWDNGFRGSLNYFMLTPEEFIESHMPFDPLWQLLEYPVSDQGFRRGTARQKQPAPINVNETVNAFLQLDSLRQLETSAARIKQAGIENERLKNWVAYNQMKIAMIYGDQDMNLYNSAVEELNKANAVFNEFVRYRNNAFSPARSDQALNAMLDPVPKLLQSASQKLDQLGRGTENFQYDPGTIKDRINVLKSRVEEQQHFLERYLASNIAERDKLFYK